MFHLVGNAHLDPAWMWPMSEGLEAFAATCRSALDRIDEFPGFIFTCSSAAHYEFVEQIDPKLFTRIQQAVKNDRWCLVGGWWVEADCNLPSGESFVRQALLGQRYFQSRFGKIASVGYNIDSFGHNANLPQLLSKAGMDSYVFMRPEQPEKMLPSALFDWRAPSGDSIMAYRLPMHYSNHQLNVREKLEKLPDYSLFTERHPWMIFYGVGNHGGGPTIAQLEEIEAMRKERGDLIYSDPERFFSEARKVSVPTVSEEMQPHAIGCYSANNEIKQLNRRSEQALQLAERTAVLEQLAMGRTEKLDLSQAWKNVCFNQFHDLLGGVSIPEACDEVISTYREAISIADRATRNSLQRLSSRIDTSSAIENLIVFNASAFDREELIEFELWHPHASEKGDILSNVVLRSADGKLIATQKIEPSGKIGEDRVGFAAKVPVPSFGWATFEIERRQEEKAWTNLQVDSESLSNGIVSLDVSEAIEESSIPVHHVHIVPPIIIDDTSDTWGHGLTAFSHDGVEFKDRIMEVIELGPLRAGLRVTSQCGNSRLEEEFFVTEGSAVIEVRVFLDWREQHKILRLRYPHRCANPTARYEIPYASIERPLGPNEWPGQSWVDVSERDGSRGLAVITDSKYSYSVDEKYISIIAARSPLYAHHVPPHKVKPVERKRYLDQGVQEFRIWLVPHSGDWGRANLSQLSEQLHRPLIVHSESAHGGDLPKSYSGWHMKGEAAIGAIKQAEDGDGIIIRAVETSGKESKISFAMGETKLSATINPFEIKSWLLRRGEATEVDLLERPL
jgi:alpha-mannosidase